MGCFDPFGAASRRLLPWMACMQILQEQKSVLVVYFDNLTASSQHFNTDDVFCCMGTTLKKAGSKSAFCKDDLEYAEIAARMAAAMLTVAKSKLGDVQTYRSDQTLATQRHSRLRTPIHPQYTELNKLTFALLFAACSFP
jgi:hypothetical protein